MSEELKGGFALPWFADETRYQRDFRVCRNIWAGNNFVAAVDASQHGVDLAASIVEAVNSYPELTTLRAENELMREALGRIDAFDTIPPMDFLTTAERLECSVGEIKDIARNALAQVAK